MKRLFALLLSLLMILSLCACQPSGGINPPTTSPTETTVTTEPAWHLQETADKLAEYATDFNWNDGVVEVILTVGLPNLDMFDRVEQLNELTYDIYLSDDTVYRMVLDAGSGDVQAIQDIATNTNFYGN